MLKTKSVILDITGVGEDLRNVLQPVSSQWNFWFLRFGFLKVVQFLKGVVGDVNSKPAGGVAGVYLASAASAFHLLNFNSNSNISSINKPMQSTLHSPQQLLPAKPMEWLCLLGADILK